MAIKVVLANCGIDPNRFRMEWVSSAEAPRFVEAVTRFVRDIKALGPNPLAGAKGCGQRLTRMVRALSADISDRYCFVITANMAR